MVNVYFLGNALLKLPSRASFHFLTADDRLLAIAQAENLLVDNPNWHP